MSKPSLVITARLASVKRARAWLSPLLEAALPGPQARFELLVAVTEALTNVIRHGYPGGAGRIRLSLAETAAWVEVSLSDHGPPFDPRQLPADLPPAGPREGGYGTGLIRRYVDRLQYRRGDGNLLLLRKFKAGP